MRVAAKKPQEEIRVYFRPQGFALEFPQGEGFEKEREAFQAAPWKALYKKGFEPPMEEGEAALRYLQTLAQSFVRCLTSQPGLEVSREDTKVPLSEETVRELLDSLPYGVGTEYVDREWIALAWEGFTKVFQEEIGAYPGSVGVYFAEKAQDLRIPERVFFHLVESRREEYPFVFLATYSTRGKGGEVTHQPLSYALVEYKKDRDKLIGLLSCLNRAAEACPMVGQFMASGELLHPLGLSAGEAYVFLRCVSKIEEAGISCRIPDWWRRRASSPKVSVRLGEKRESLLGFQSLISMSPAITLDGVQLTRKEIEDLLSQAEGLAMIKGKWVEVNHEKLEELLQVLSRYEGDLTLLDALRMQGGMEKTKEQREGQVEVTNGAWLACLMERLRHPMVMGREALPQGVRATLRPYQLSGYGWLWQMAALGFGACLADDMGLGKTLQVLTFLQKLYQMMPMAQVLLVVPASLIGNWEKESARFTPELPLLRLHGLSSQRLEKLLEEEKAFLTITTYGMVSRMEGIAQREWTGVILDEAQAIKNPGAGQTKAVKRLKANFRIAMTGTPIENDLGNLWSLFDFLNQGLLGTAKEFSAFAKDLSKEKGYARLKRMVSPFILRRLKTDKRIISDLPDKVEMTEYVGLTRKQIALYNKEVKDLTTRVATLDGIARKGLILQSISRFKQICNHPDQYTGMGGYAPGESGKFQALEEICETIREKHERMLLFTQYKEICAPLDDFLASLFGRRGLVLHGDVKVKERQRMVEEFNGETYVPYMILTIKAGGTGLNLVGANHVVLFDRWWNPAVESQAIDRAFRIGQTKDVLVHKFVTRSTIEEKIAEMLSAKQELAGSVIGEGSEVWVTEMSNEELLDLVKLGG